ncbi:MAG: thioredoxin family protein [Bacteroidetes bacterium]|nr:thioredoxin family protein [Bacteroidota bacterium]MCL6100613.1 thioredoxin family protein [Bacteroidota bacterium]
MYLDDQIKAEMSKQLSVLTKNVKLVMFTQELECQYCRETKQILTELSEVSDKISLEVKNFINDKADAEKYGVDKIPATVIVDENGKDYGIKFYGIPSGYEFASLLEDIKLLGTGITGFDPQTENEIKNLDSDVHMQVFVTPTCPYCPQAVITAHKFAYLNDRVKSDMIEATEFPHLSNKYNVRGVPRTVINENTFIEGAAPEQMVFDKVKEALAQVVQ